MRRSTPLRVPVLTFLSRSPSASRQSLRLLEQLTGLQRIIDDTSSHRDVQSDSSSSSSSSSAWTRDALDDSAFSSALLNRWHFNSAASICPTSKVVIHLLSISDDEQAQGQTKNRTATSSNVLSLLSVTDDGSSNATASVQQSRDYLSQHLKSGGGTLLGAQLVMRCRTDGRYPVEAHHLLDGSVLPLLDLSSLPVYDKEKSESIVNEDDTNDESAPSYSKTKSGISGIRELVIPTFENEIQSQLSSCSGLSRPKVGLYRWPGHNNNGNGGIVIRPLPSAAEDRELSSPSLVFQCNNLESCAESLMRAKNNDDDDDDCTVLAKVGFSGCGRGGQYMIRNELLNGLDVRICESTELSSSFAEAQESLLAASLDELQSINIMNEGGADAKTKGDRLGTEGRSDAMNGLGDCWVEFRANVKKPGGFFGRKGGMSGGGAGRSKPEIAKAPDIPYQ